MLKNKFRNIALSLAVIMGVSLSTPAFAKSEYNSGDVLAFGSDLTKAQENELREFFDAPDGTRTIYITDETIIEQLGLDPNDPANYAGGCYSSAYVKLLDGNKGITVDARNLTEVTESMLMNALITSGISSASVKVSAPFKVTGTSALSGILAGVEEVGGFEISLKQKETAQKEIETTMDVAEEVGQEQASTIINDVKTEVIKEQPKTEEEVAEIVDKVTEQYNINISDNSKESLVVLMNDVKDLDLDYSELKDALNKAGDTLKENLKDLGVKLKDEGFFEKIGNWFKNLWDKFISLFKSDEPKDTTEPVQDTINSDVENSSNTEKDNDTTDEVPVESENDTTNANDEEVTTPENTETIELEKQVGDTIVDDDQDTNTNEDDNTIEKVEEETNTN